MTESLGAVGMNDPGGRRMDTEGLIATGVEGAGYEVAVLALVGLEYMLQIRCSLQDSLGARLARFGS